jgi:hypothetical protein
MQEFELNYTSYKRKTYPQEEDRHLLLRSQCLWGASGRRVRGYSPCFCLPAVSIVGCRGLAEEL